MTQASVLLSDNLNEVGVLKRREIEVRILAPILESLSTEFGRERVQALVIKQIVQIAHDQGVLLAESAGGDSLLHFSRILENWKKDDAMQMDVLQLDEQGFSFNVTRCRYADLQYAWSTTLNFSGFVQVNADTDEMVTNLRMNFIHAPLSDLFLLLPSGARWREGPV